MPKKVACRLVMTIEPEAKPFASVSKQQVGSLEPK